MSGPDDSQPASTSSASTSTTTSIADSYNTTRYDTTNLSNVGNLGAGAIDTRGGSILYAGALQAGGNIRSNFGNLTIGSPGANSVGGGLLDAIKPYLPYVLAGVGLIAVLFLLKR